MINSGAAFNFFCSGADITGGLQILWNFTETEGSGIYSVPFAKSAYSGTIFNTGSYYRSPGSGYFDGTRSGARILFNNVSGLNSNSWTKIITYEQSGAGNQILFSSYQSNLSATNPIYSGFVLGINNAGRPYLEYFSPGGPQILQSTNNFANKNTLFITKTTNSITLENCDYNKKVFETENFFVDDTFFLPSNVWNLGGTGENSPSYFSGQNFKGWIDTFCYFSPAVLSNQKQSIFSGLFCQISGIPGAVTSGSFSTITGYSTGQTLIFSGKTGEAISFANYQISSCGRSGISYQITDLSGTVYESFVSGISQTITNFFTGSSGSAITENSGYSRSFGMSAVSYLKNSNSGDISELFYFPNSTNKININNKLIFDRVQNLFIVPEIYNTDQLNFFVDSINQFGSGYSITGGFYNLGIDFSGTFYNSGNYIGGNYDFNDTNILDIISGSRAFNTGGYTILGNTTGISGFYAANSSYFLQGVKLKSGIDYTLQGTGFVLKEPYFYGIANQKIWTNPNDLESVFASGSWNNTGVVKFARGTSILYMNGLRENINNDYVELSEFSPLNNISNYLADQNTLYNNNGLFTENL